jgi:hypothetical protein
MLDIKTAVLVEMYLSFYEKWQKGKYYSSKGMKNIDQMSSTHLDNAINYLTKYRDNRKSAISQLEDDESGLVNFIKETIISNGDIISVKILELTEELLKRDKK